MTSRAQGAQERQQMLEDDARRYLGVVVASFERLCRAQSEGERLRAQAALAAAEEVFARRIEAEQRNRPR